ncbi:MAG: hypothetical protein E5V33_10685, partial [Mesorhizobium sp.]
VGGGAKSFDRLDSAVADIIGEPAFAFMPARLGGRQIGAADRQRITHDLATAHYIADDICVMQNGTIVERGLTKEVIAGPAHPYTKLLLGAVANPDNPRRSAEPL